MSLLKSNKLDSEFYFSRTDRRMKIEGIKFVPLKRPFDFLLSLIGLAVSFPIWGVVAAAIWLEGGRPIFFVQKRLGKNGKEFWLFKFRSMIKNAEEQTGPVWAGKSDHRITKVGKILRKTALDELPQLLNILKGDMSFVGPRAERPELVKDILREIPEFNLRLLVRPGLTGLAQVYGNYDTPPRNKLRYDLVYIKNQSFLMDIKLVLLSFWFTFTLKWANVEKDIHKIPGLIMLEEGVINEEQLEEALEYQRKGGGRIGNILIDKGYITRADLNRCLNIQLTMNGKKNRSDKPEENIGRKLLNPAAEANYAGEGRVKNVLQHPSLRRDRSRKEV